MDIKEEYINNLEKEIEKYKKLANSNLSDELIFSERICPEDTFIIQENYISKDKIRAKIKSLEEKIHIVIPNEYNKVEIMNEFKNEGAVDILKELLEEE